MSENASWLLVSIGVIFCILEIFIPGFVILPIGIGAMIAGFAGYFGAPFSWVLVIWSVSSIVAWFTLRNLFKNSPEETYKTGIEALVGKEGKVIEPIDENKGRIKIFGDEWEVINESGKSIPVGDKVMVIGFEGNKLKI